MEGLKDITKKVLSHIELYVTQLGDTRYARPLPLLSEASIGSHTRHILDGFFCLMNQQCSGKISYDKRDRDLLIQTQSQYALEKIKEVKAFISNIQLEGDCEFEAVYANKSFTTTSSLEREIIHNIEHVIHHLAIIKIALKHYYPEIELPKSFGVAFSTLQYWKEEGIAS